MHLPHIGKTHHGKGNMIMTTPDTATSNTVYLWVANWDLNQEEAAGLLPKDAPWVTMVDTIHNTARNIPSATKKIAGYVTGTAAVMWTDTDWGRFSNDETGKVQINQAGNSDPLTGNVLDVEAGAWTIADAVNAAVARRKAGRQCNFYVSASNQAGLETGLRAQGFDEFAVVAVQWASPSSNPDTNLPGTKLTLSQANCDLSVAVASWFGPDASPPPPQSISGLIVQENLETHAAKSVDGGKTWTID